MKHDDEVVLGDRRRPRRRADPGSAVAHLIEAYARHERAADILPTGVDARTGNPPHDPPHALP
jgi:hypothetical protein